MDIVSKQQASALGLKKYFTGKPCKQGHIAERYVAKSTCCECLKINAEKTRDARNARSRERYHSMSEDQREKERNRLKLLARKKYKENPQAKRDASKKYRDRNKEKAIQRCANWRKENPEKLKSYRQQEATKAMARFFTSSRRARIAQAIPPWADLKEIEKIYESCPSGYHVDHIVPLISKKVCGLHCEANLRQIPARENQQKNNLWWPDMP